MVKLVLNMRNIIFLSFFHIYIQLILLKRFCTQMWMGVHSTRKYDVFKKIFIKSGGFDKKIKMACDFFCGKNYLKK